MAAPIHMPNMQAHNIASATCPAKNGAPVKRISVNVAMLIKKTIKPKETLDIKFTPIVKINIAAINTT